MKSSFFPSILGLYTVPLYVTKSFDSSSALPLLSYQQSRRVTAACETCVITVLGRRDGSGKGTFLGPLPSLWNSSPGALACLARNFQAGLVALRTHECCIFVCQGERGAYVFHKSWNSAGFGEAVLKGGWPSCKSPVLGGPGKGRCPQESSIGLPPSLLMSWVWHMLK